MNGSLPERIIVFRDGVGEGQASYLTELEIPQIIECFRTFGETCGCGCGCGVTTVRIFLIAAAQVTSTNPSLA